MAKGPHKTDAPIAELTDAAARCRLAGGIGVLPVGSVEQHGRHLRVSTDAEIAIEVSRRVCKLAGYVMLPALSYGVSFEHAPGLNLSVRATTLRRLVVDIAASLADAGARGLVVINGHHGNQRHLAKIPSRVPGYSSKKTIKCMVVPYWKFMSVAFDHAGHVETSLMLACSSADMRHARRGFVEPATTTARQHDELARRASKSFLSVAKNGVWGDPRLATRATGTRLFDEMSANIAHECRRHMRIARR